MHAPMQGAGAMLPKQEGLPVKNTVRGWKLYYAHTKSHYYVDGLSLCGRLSCGPETELFNDLHRATHNCVICAKKRDHMFPEEV